MEDNTALPTDGNVAAGEQAQQTQAAAEPQEGQQQPAEGQQAEGAEQGDKPEAGKKEKTPEQREIERLRRRVDNLTRRRYELEARVPQQPAQGSGQTQSQASDDEPVTLSRAELQKMIAEQAKQLAPVVSEQQAEIERRQGVVQKLEKSWGKDEFDAKASELDEVMGGLMDNGRPKAATDAIFDADDPKAVIEYLTDPDNADEAERLSRLPRGRVDREIARIEAKLAEAKKAAKPKPSNAARPLEPAKGGGAPNGMPDPSDTKAYIAWANQQERR